MSPEVNEPMRTAEFDQERNLLQRTVEALFADHCPPEVVAAAEGSWSSNVWAELAQAGLTTVGLDEQAGGSGGTLADAAVVLRTAAAYAAPVPLAEALFPVAAGCSAAALRMPPGPVTVAAGLRYRRIGTSVEFAGTARRVPYARVAERVLLVAAPERVEGRDSGPELAMWVDAEALTLSAGDNLAGEPRDELTVGRCRTTTSDVAEVAIGTADLVGQYGALARAVQIAGALGGALDLTLRYAGERVQFGRPIGRFQAVQHLVSQLAAAVAASEAAANAAVLAVAACGPGVGALDQPAALALACSKARTSHAAGLGARIAHQVHGAIGFTQEHRLHHLTRRLWSWREEYGSDEHWSAVIGDMVIKSGPEHLWPNMTRN